MLENQKFVQNTSDKYHCAPVQLLKLFFQKTQRILIKIIRFNSTEMGDWNKKLKSVAKKRIHNRGWTRPLFVSAI